MARSRFTSSGWWRWQFRRPLVVISNALSFTVLVFRRCFPKRLSDQEQWDVWKRDVEIIQKHITDVFRHRLLFRETTAILQAHPTLRVSHEAGYWYDWLRHLYAHYITMAVRRELDRGADAPNLFRLLFSISKRTGVFSRARYLAQFKDSPVTREFGMRLWEKTFTDLAGEGDCIDRAIVRRDMKQLDKQAALVVIYANRIVAHRTESEVAVTMRHVNSSLEMIESILQKYYVLLTARSLVGAEPSVLVNWSIAFSVPWILPEE